MSLFRILLKMISSSIKIWSRRKRMGSDVDNGGRLDYVITYSCSVIPYLRRDRTRNRNGPAACETCKTRLGGIISILFQSEASQFRCFLMEFMFLYQAELLTNGYCAGWPAKVSSTSKHDRGKGVCYICF